MPKKIYIPVLAAVILLLAAGSVYFARRADINYYFYSKKVAKQPNFSEQKGALEKDYKKVYENPKDPAAYINLGVKQYQLKDYASAEANYLKALKLAPTSVVAYENLIRTYEADNKLNLAEKYATEFADRFPDLSDSYVLLGELYRFYLTAKQDKLPEVYATGFEKAKDPQYLLLQAGYFADRNDYKKAIDYVQQWLADKNNTQNRGIVEKLLKDYQSEVK